MQTDIALHCMQIVARGGHDTEPCPPPNGLVLPPARRPLLGPLAVLGPWREGSFVSVCTTYVMSVLALEKKYLSKVWIAWCCSAELRSRRVYPALADGYQTARGLVVSRFNAGCDTFPTSMANVVFLCILRARVRRFLTKIVMCWWIVLAARKSFNFPRQNMRIPLHSYILHITKLFRWL
jgi:hypothetical protein